MIPTDFSVLLLAWDDADPAVVVLGGSALPPTLPLVYQLAAQHPVLALYPHLPAAEATAALEPSASAGGAAANAAGAAADSAEAFATAGSAGAGSAEILAAAGPLGSVVDGPGVHLLPAADGRGEPAAPAGSSRLVGLDEWQPAIASMLPSARRLPNTPAGADEPLAPATGRSQWPTGSGPLLAKGVQVPAAPYAGAAGPADASTSYASARPVFPPPPPAPPRPAAAAPASAVAGAAGGSPPETLATPPASATPAATHTASVAATAAINSGSEVVLPAHFDEPVEEIGAAEARDLDAPEDNLVPDAVPAATPPAAAAEAAAATPSPEPVTAWALRQPVLAGLNFRMIQYARRAAQLVAGRHDFGVIYAPGWPAWLAALEIRNRSGRPLVLYVPALPSATAPAAERGWLLGLERMTLRRATLVLVPDAGILEQLRACHADVPGEVRIVPAADEAAVQRVLAEVALG